MVEKPLGSGLYVEERVMLTIDKLKWDHKEFNQPSELLKVLASRLSQLKINTKIGIDGNKLIFNPVTGGKIALSSVDNKIAMAPGDPRIVKKGRDYLDTKRLTKEQYNGFFNVIQGTLDELQLNAEVVLADKGKHVLRAGKVKSAPPILKSYPKAK